MISCLKTVPFLCFANHVFGMIMLLPSIEIIIRCISLKILFINIKAPTSHVKICVLVPISLKKLHSFDFTLFLR